MTKTRTKTSTMRTTRTEEEWVGRRRECELARHVSEQVGASSLRGHDSSVSAWGLQEIAGTAQVWRWWAI